MRIVNNKIYIYRGETPTYNADIITKDEGAPFMILTGINNPYIEFTVRKSLYAHDDCYAIRVFLDMNSIHKFPTDEIAQYTDADWNDTIKPTLGNEEKLHKKTTGVTDLYRYYDYSVPGDYTSTGVWTVYKLAVSIPFTRVQTVALEPKTYQYEISLLGGNIKEQDDTFDGVPIVVDYKQPLLTPHDFIVEGSVNE